MASKGTVSKDSSTACRILPSSLFTKEVPLLKGRELGENKRDLKTALESSNLPRECHNYSQPEPLAHVQVLLQFNDKVIFLKYPHYYNNV